MSITVTIAKHFDLLGYRAKDAVTGYTGVVTSLSFDLYGCVQALVHPGMDKDGKVLEQMWFDVSRLVLDDEPPVMPAPNFLLPTSQAAGLQAPAEKPQAAAKPTPGIS